MNKDIIFYTSIAGINFRCTDDDLGPVIGYVQKDPENQYNPNAIGVYRVNGSLLGYIPDSKLEKFYKFKEGFDQLVFAGNIKKLRGYNDNKEYYVGNIAIIKSQDEQELTRLIDENLFENFNLYGRTFTSKDTITEDALEI